MIPLAFNIDDCDENNYLDDVFNKNNYNKDFVRRNTYKDTWIPNVTNNDTTPVTTVTIPYVKGTSETIARILQPCNIRVAHKPIATLRQLLTKVNDKDEPNRRLGAVYKSDLYWWDRQKFKRTTDWTQTGNWKWWYQQSHCWAPFTIEPQNRLGLPSALPTVQITINDSLWKAGLLT